MSNPPGPIAELVHFSLPKRVHGWGDVTVSRVAVGRLCTYDMAIDSSESGCVQILTLFSLSDQNSISLTEHLYDIFAYNKPSLFLVPCDCGPVLSVIIRRPLSGRRYAGGS
jgi:hypothetical protein